MAKDGTLWNERIYCLEYEEYLRRAELAIKDIDFRPEDDNWSETGIRQLDREQVLDAWKKFTSITIQLIRWDGRFKSYKRYSDESPRDIEQKLIELLGKYGREGRNVWPYTLNTENYNGFIKIRRKFSAVNFTNGEEYVGTFGESEDRDGFLRSITCE